MALDVYLLPQPELPRAEEYPAPLCSVSEGCYWFLHPVFERLAAETGQYVDLYGGAAFSGPALAALSRALHAARDQVEAQADRWEVVTGVRIAPARQEVRATVTKREARELLDRLQAAAQRAREAGLHLVFLGD